MLRRQEEFIRVGVRALIVAAIAGLIVLMLHGTAYPQERWQPEKVAQVLAARERPSATQRLEQAERLLQRERGARRAAASGVLLETAWSALAQPSPHRVIRHADRLLGHVDRLKRRSPAEDQALELLEAEIEAGTDDPRVGTLYQALREREDEERLARWLAEARDAIRSADLSRARRNLSRAAGLRPNSPEVAVLRLALRDRERAKGRVSETRSATSAAGEPPEVWEAQLAARLLLEDYSDVLAVESSRADARFAKAVALYLSGERADGRDAFERLSEVGGETGRLASYWMEWSFAPTGAFEPTRENSGEETRDPSAWATGRELLGIQEEPRHQTFRTLGHALSISERIVDGPRAAGRGLRKVATRYLKVRLDPARRSLEASIGAWLRGGHDTPERRSAREKWNDGYLELPRARTHYGSIGLRPILASRAALGLALGGDPTQIPELAKSEAVLLRPVAAGTTSESPLLSGEDARRLVVSLARGLEGGALYSKQGSHGEVLEHVRRIDSAILQGMVVAVEPWKPEWQSLRESLQGSLVNGKTSEGQGFTVRTKSRRLDVNGELFADPLACPSEALCIERSRAVRATLYGRVALSGDLQLGARTSFRDATLALELSKRGPHASLQVPICRWLGLARWLPIDAYFELGLGGVSAGPRYSPTESSLQPSL